MILDINLSQVLLKSADIDVLQKVKSNTLLNINYSLDEFCSKQFLECTKLQTFYIKNPSLLILNSLSNDVFPKGVIVYCQNPYQRIGLSNIFPDLNIKIENYDEELDDLTSYSTNGIYEDVFVNYNSVACTFDNSGGTLKINGNDCKKFIYKMIDMSGLSNKYYGTYKFIYTHSTAQTFTNDQFANSFINRIYFNGANASINATTLKNWNNDYTVYTKLQQMQDSDIQFFKSGQIQQFLQFPKSINDLTTVQNNFKINDISFLKSGEQYNGKEAFINVRPSENIPYWLNSIVINNNLNSLVYFQANGSTKGYHAKISQVYCQSNNIVMNNSNSGIQFLTSNRRAAMSGTIIYNYQNVKYIICQADILPSMLDQFNKETCKILFIPVDGPQQLKNETINNLKQNFYLRNIDGCYVNQQDNETLIIPQLDQTNMEEYKVKDGDGNILLDVKHIDIQYTITFQLINTDLRIKYNEYMLTLIKYLYVNNQLVDIIFTRNYQYYYDYRKRWCWQFLEKKTQYLKFSIQEKYYDGEQLIDKDDEDIVMDNMYIRMYIK